MNSQLLIALLQQVVIPEIATAIRAHFNATGQMPTDADILKALALDASTGVAIGQAWLAAHPSA